MWNIIKKQTANDWIMWVMFTMGIILSIFSLTTHNKLDSIQFSLQSMMFCWFGLISWQVSLVLSKLRDFDKRMDTIQYTVLSKKEL